MTERQAGEIGKYVVKFILITIFCMAFDYLFLDEFNFLVYFVMQGFMTLNFLYKYYC